MLFLAHFHPSMYSHDKHDIRFCVFTWCRFFLKFWHMIYVNSVHLCTKFYWYLICTRGILREITGFYPLVQIEIHSFTQQHSPFKTLHTATVHLDDIGENARFFRLPLCLLFLAHFYSTMYSHDKHGFNCCVLTWCYFLFKFWHMLVVDSVHLCSKFYWYLICTRGIYPQFVGFYPLVQI